MIKIYSIQREYHDLEGFKHNEAINLAFTSLKAAQDYTNKLNGKEYYLICEMKLVNDGAELEEGNDKWTI